MNNKTAVRQFRVDDIPLEKVTDQIDRRLITGDRIMLAHVYLKKGSIVPAHSHENEQISYVLKGALHFWIGEDGSEKIAIRTGEVLLIPSNIVHKAKALEETLTVDVFTPHVRIGLMAPTHIFMILNTTLSSYDI